MKPLNSAKAHASKFTAWPAQVAAASMVVQLSALCAVIHAMPSWWVIGTLVSGSLMALDELRALPCIIVGILGVVQVTLDKKFEWYVGIPVMASALGYDYSI